MVDSAFTVILVTIESHNIFIILKKNFLRLQNIHSLVSNIYSKPWIIGQSKRGEKILDIKFDPMIAEPAGVSKFHLNETYMNRWIHKITYNKVA